MKNDGDPDMFKNILQHLKDAYTFSPLTIAWLDDVCHYWQAITPETESKLLQLKEKYSYEKLVKLREPGSSVTQLEFWKAIGEFSLTPAIDDHEIDREYINFVIDFNGKIDYGDFDIYELPSEDIDYYYEVINRIFYTWIGYLWQNVNGKDCGIPVCTLENNSVKRFYFNDFLFDDYTAFGHNSPDKRIEGTIFNRTLAIEEIYMRTAGDYRNNTKPFQLEFENKSEVIKLSRAENKTILIHTQNSESTVREEITHLPNLTFDNSREIAGKYVIQKSNELLNKGWRLKLARTDLESV